MLVTILVALRDAILAAALAWVGISVEQRSANETACAGAAATCERAE
jgi:hypothetical protein